MNSTPILSRLSLGVAATATSASGAIVVFDIPDVTYDNYVLPGTVYVSAINLQTGSFSIQTSGVTTPRFQISVGYGSYASIALSGNGVLASTSFLFADGLIGPALGFANPPGFFYTYAVPTGTIYLGLSLSNSSDIHYGWFEIESTNGSVGGQDVFTFTRFAFNDVAGQSIFAGQTTAIPEASTLGLAGGLFGLVAAAHLRRRKLKQAAASDKFLALAAGEKLN